MRDLKRLPLEAQVERLEEMVKDQEEKIEHLSWVIEEMIELPPEWADKAAELCGTLSKSEARILGMLMQRAGRPVPRSVLLTAVAWDRPGDEAGPKTADVHVHHIRRKLGKAGVPGQIQSVRHVGFMWLSPIQARVPKELPPPDKVGVNTPGGRMAIRADVADEFGIRPGETVKPALWNVVRFYERQADKAERKRCA